VTLSLASGSATLNGTLTRAASSGIATFNDIMLSKNRSVHDRSR